LQVATPQLSSPGSAASLRSFFARFFRFFFGFAAGVAADVAGRCASTPGELWGSGLPPLFSAVAASEVVAGVLSNETESGLGSADDVDGLGTPGAVCAPESCARPRAVVLLLAGSAAAGAAAVRGTLGSGWDVASVLGGLGETRTSVADTAGRGPAAGAPHPMTMLAPSPLSTVRKWE